VHVDVTTNSRECQAGSEKDIWIGMVEMLTLKSNMSEPYCVANKHHTTSMAETCRKKKCIWLRDEYAGVATKK